MNELNFTISMNAHQVELYKAAREEFAKNARDIDNIKQMQKDDVDSLIDGLGWERKEHKGQIKALKKSLALYAKQQAVEQKALMDEAAELANL
jgi:Skp family chaperone for outer membrane proteins